MSSKDEIEVEKQVVDKKNISSAEEKPINTLNKDKDSKANKEVIDKLDATLLTSVKNNQSQLQQTKMLNKTQKMKQRKIA